MPIITLINCNERLMSTVAFVTSQTPCGEERACLVSRNSFTKWSDGDIARENTLNICECTAVWSCNFTLENAAHVAVLFSPQCLCVFVFRTLSWPWCVKNPSVGSACSLWPPTPLLQTVTSTAEVSSSGYQSIRSTWRWRHFLHCSSFSLHGQVSFTMTSITFTLRCAS